ncbi:UNVERIFIED_CONTAM: hypothetical protein PYX00_007757 [Menopon gallinae]|uniref:Ig-like domain-containing protein n=1 Tax=Menopon gallinae TaxID=328185 RepID=A0AAW2HLJ8_9NEOP
MAAGNDVLYRENGKNGEWKALCGIVFPVIHYRIFPPPNPRRIRTTHLECWESLIILSLSAGSVREVHAVVKQSASLPCDITSTVDGDSVILVVWYKDEMTPIYR